MANQDIAVVPLNKQWAECRL